MKGERLKFPQIASFLDECQLDLGEWKPQLEQEIGLGTWTFGDVKKIVRLHLKDASLLLEQIKENGFKLKAEERRQLRAIEKFFEDIRGILQNV